LPTTLLAQVDSSVGGKTGINTAQGKNLVGAFYQPAAVVADLDLLRTLPERQFVAGYAEVVKYALLGELDFYRWLDHNFSDLKRGNAQAQLHAVKLCCEAKARLVAVDETELGARALLNLGHTFGHALDAATGYSDRLFHGEAVAIGIAMAFRFSASLGFCPPAEAEEVARHLRRAGLPAAISDRDLDLPEAPALLKIMHQDKKARAGKLNFILLHGIGKAFIARDIDESSVLAFISAELARR
jgi:3-dehydroquinate synthase